VATAKVKPNARPYTGTSDGIAKARRAGMDEWIKQAIAASDNTLNNLGSYMVRDQKGHKGVLSVHSTGRAVDLGFTNRKAALKFINTVARNANDLGVECILDYFLDPLGVAGVATVNAGSVTLSAQSLAHLAEDGHTLRSPHKLPTR
jgi:hypothetical protein